MKTQPGSNRTIFIVAISAILLIACALAIILFIVFFGFFLYKNQPNPTPTQTVPQVDLIWDRINQNQKIIVGISADYPPFAYVDQNFAIQGYDLALIQEVGKRLNLPLDIRNMAFDVLVNSLFHGQIDIAIAAISITPQRDQLIDFTNVYLFGEDAVLARQDSLIQITQSADLANYRVGVQKATSFEEWIKTNLITPGLMSRESLITYLTPENAIEALISPNPEIDLVMLDAQPADLFATSKPVKVVIRGLDPQRFAIAIPHNAPTLQANLNQVLTDMQDDGTLNLLAQEYLFLSIPEPLPTSEPTLQPVTPPDCLDGMKYIQDLNLPDSNMTSPPIVQPGITLGKGWRIQNIGTCTWDSNYQLVFVGSNPPNVAIGGDPVAIQGQVLPGQLYDIYASIVTPQQPGRYQSFWDFRNSTGQYFGSHLWIGFDVVSQPPPTTPPQAPIISRFTVDRYQIFTGQCVSMSWQFTGSNITLSRIFGNDQLLFQDLPFTGSAPNCPPTPGIVEYRLQVDTQSGGSAVASQIVSVLPPTQPTYTPIPTPVQPPLIKFFVVDDNQISLGQCINLTWSFSGSNLTATELFRNNTLIDDRLFPSDSQQDCPASTGTQQYRLQLTSLTSGVTQSSVFVNVTGPVPTTTPIPVIQSFTAQPNKIDQGGCVNLNWSFTAPGQVNSYLLRDGQTIASNLSFQGGFQDCLNVEILSGQVQYSLRIDYAPEGTVAADRVVSVNP